MLYTTVENKKGLDNEASQEGAEVTADTIITQMKDMGYTEVTAYTLGRGQETDDTPCEGAFGDDLCALKFLGVNICASNYYNRGQVLKLEFKDDTSYTCYVLDRMNSKYNREVDIAMTDWEESKKFGRKENTTVIKVDQYVRH